MSQAENHVLPGATNDSWRTWLMTGARRSPVDRRRMRGAHKGLKKMLVEGMGEGDLRPHAWKDFSGAMIRHAVDEAMRALPVEDKQVVKLAYFGGYSNREIANEVGLTVATVQRRLRRALAMISEYVQHGRSLGRRALYGLMIWLSSRTLADSTHHLVQGAAVAIAATIILTQPTPPTARPSATNPAPALATATANSAPHRVAPPIPSPTAAQAEQAIPTIQTPSVKLPIALPPLPTPPVKVKLPAV